MKILNKTYRVIRFIVKWTLLVIFWPFELYHQIRKLGGNA